MTFMLIAQDKKFGINQPTNKKSLNENWLMPDKIWRRFISSSELSYNNNKNPVDTLSTLL